MSDSVSQPSARFRVGGDLEIHRLGFGAMRITGKGVWGPPPDREAALRLLRRVPELGVDFIDTADSYGPDVSEQLICEALHPYEGLVIATKGGLTRGGPDQWTPDGRPDYLIAQARKSLRKLGVERIDLWQLHRIDPKVPRDEQFGAIRQMLDEGLVRHAGLSEVGVEDIEAARKVFPVATVQNRYNLADRASEHVLEHCERLGIGFIPWYPLAAGSLARPGSVLDAVARHHGASGGQIALAWLLRRSPVMLPIPGTGSIEHLEQNMGAATIRLSDEDFAAIERAAR
ncbi:MAG: aldo/keto reductase [Betaproteobacteria bacterium]|nr:aldo/keto reductase [Betaproteobacteria bacterium]MBU6512371.1 aldo/keto reductase [Betaproteobacteria bacterium]MDE1954359.1 aldo/keto reductase [Betaproteobacteria bacterium]MDE2152340.1 aldo/keto reductase [Betaproteobacteria bacterium]MDE2479821.1 aldo/keto reductase [Betaproteobacteria bacterium]